MGSGGKAARKIYAKDPIHEALCEFHFSQPSEGWIAMPFKIQERLRFRYPNDPISDVQAMPVPMSVGPQMIAAPITLGMSNSGRLRFVGEDNRNLLLVSPGLIGVSAVAPYAGWPVLKERVGEALRAVSDVCNGKFSISRIGVRYINRVVAPVESVGDFFELTPLSFGDVDVTTKSFVSRSEMRVEDDDNRVLIAMFATAFDAAGSKSVILDLDAIAQNLGDVVTVEQAMALVEELRVFERQAFESAIKESARTELFGGYSEENDD